MEKEEEEEEEELLLILLSREEERQLAVAVACNREPKHIVPRPCDAAAEHRSKQAAMIERHHSQCHLSSEAHSAWHCLAMAILKYMAEEVARKDRGTSFLLNQNTPIHS
ncbi:hypothetical protein WUBG_06437 [Wuchereria bancrofti]|uniref:Uncharacterized protein n=1 Tax=Wuchereria bancrofti TaxID=6293 RepID=J9EKF4_WUCBA|nr:hypothetical protein WUBG_06437 [Wuchereria bancrofti]